jgi:CDP-diglyceride synthetase
MSWVELHARLASTASLFVGILAIWALLLRIRGRDLSGAWLGAAVIGELLVIAQGLVGVYLYFSGFSAALSRPFLHILYGIVAMITLPAAYGYFGQLEDERAKTLAMALVCAFLWGIMERASIVAHFVPPV